MAVVLEPQITHTQGSDRSRLLPELLDKIFLYLHFPPKWDKCGDRRDLLACRLVNHLWADVAYRHAFSAISCSIGTPTDVRPTAATPTWYPSLQSLRDFLLASPDLRDVIQTLSLVSNTNYPHDSIDVSCLHSILSLLPRLRNVCLDGICQRATSVSSGQHRPRLSVERIEVPMNGFLEASADDFLNVIDMFEEVDELVLDGLWLVRPGKITPRPMTTRIRHIDYPGTRFNEFYKVLQNFDTRYLTSLSIVPCRIWVQPKAWDRFLALLRSIGAQLIHLGIQFGGRMEMRAHAHIHAEVFDMCTRLRTVCFSFGPVPSDYFKVGWERLVGTMPHLPSSVQLLIFELDFGAEVDLLRGVDNLRRAFEALVVDRRPSTIVSVRPDVRPMFGNDEQTEIKALFPRLAAENLLQF